MLKFDEEQLLAEIASAVALRDQTEALVADVTARGLKNLFLVGAGGSYAVMLPYEHLMRSRSSLPVRAVVAAELILSGDLTLGTRSVAIFASASGTTEDVLSAIEYAKQHGVYTVGLTREGDSPIAHAVDVALLFPSHTYDVQMLLIVTKVLHSRGEFTDYERFAGELVELPSTVVDIATRADPIAATVARKHKETGYHFLIGSGNPWGFTYSYSMCVLEECQWLHTTRVHAAEFFHGSLELIEKDTSVILFVGEDETRPLMDRVITFVTQYSNDVSIFDAADYPLARISPDFRGLFSPLVIHTVGTRISTHLEAERNHDLTLRRYYRVVEY